MAYTLFYIVGNSDVKINGEAIKSEHYRQRTLQIVERLKNLGQTPTGRTWQLPPPSAEDKEWLVSFPIIQSLLGLIDPPPEEAVLIATDQNDPCFQHSDTIHAAELLKIFLKSKLSIDAKIEPVPYNPADYDLMYAFFEQFFKLYEHQLTTNCDNYFCLSAGTPAMSHAFALLSLPFPFSYYYVSRNGQAKPIHFYQTLNKNRYAQLITDLCQRYHYNAALQQLKISPFRNHQQIQSLLAATIARWSFDWQSTIEHVHSLKNAHSQEHDCSPTELEYFKWVSNIMRGEDRAYYLLEMLSHLEIALNLGDCQLFIAWLFNMLENLRILLIQRCAGIAIKKNNNDFSQWHQFLESHPDIFSEEDIQRKKADRTTIFKALKKINDRVKNHSWEKELVEHDQNALALAVDFLDRIEKEKIVFAGREFTIQDLRNEGPFAHGQHGINIEFLRQYWQPFGLKGMLEDLKLIINRLTNGSYRVNPFDQINRQIETYLQRAMTPPPLADAAQPSADRPPNRQQRKHRQG